MKNIRHRIAGGVTVFYPYGTPIIVIGSAQAVGIAPISIHNPELPIARAVGSKDNLRAIGRPGGTPIYFGDECIFANFASIERFIITYSRQEWYGVLPYFLQKKATS